jgi:hypothetical protein
MKTMKQIKKLEKIQKLLKEKGWTPKSKIIKMLITQLRKEGEI